MNTIKAIFLAAGIMGLSCQAPGENCSQAFQNTHDKKFINDEYNRFMDIHSYYIIEALLKKFTVDERKYIRYRYENGHVLRLNFFNTAYVDTKHYIRLRAGPSPIDQIVKHKMLKWIFIDRKGYVQLAEKYKYYLYNSMRSWMTTHADQYKIPGAVYQGPLINNRDHNPSAAKPQSLYKPSPPPPLYTANMYKHFITWWIKNGAQSTPGSRPIEFKDHWKNRKKQKHETAESLLKLLQYRAVKHHLENIPLDFKKHSTKH